jgi:lipopolysaccharide transport system ATP-binding protein
VRDIARELLFRGDTRAPARLRPREFWALDDVSFTVRRGESLAVIGANGAGKSTLLKVLYGLVKPDGGQARIAGRVGALIELGTGFDATLSGRENVHVNAALHGFTRRQTDALMDEIADFSGLEEMMDVPLQFYSSGMQARLSYAVAAHLRPDVLLVDEVLAVGDLAYQRKCINHMQSYLDGGGALVFVSHSPYQVQAICQQGIVLDRGRLTFSGSAVDALGAYLDAQQESTAKEVGTRAQRLDAEHPLAVESISMESASGGELRTGEAACLTIRCNALESMEVLWGFTLWTADRWVCITGNNTSEPRRLPAGRSELRCVVPRLTLATGRYLLRGSIRDAVHNFPLATYGWEDTPQAIRVVTPTSRQAVVEMATTQLTTIDVEWK